MEKVFMKQALARYIVETGQQDDWPKHGVDTCLAILPHLQKLAPRWAKVNKQNFHPGTFAAHQVFYDQMCNSLRSKRELKGLVKDEMDKLRHETVTEHGGDTDDEAPEYVFVDDDHVMQEAVRTPEFEKPDDQINSSTWAQPVDPVNKFLKNVAADVSVHSGPILWQNHHDKHSVLEELKELHTDCLQKKKAYLVSLEKWMKLHDSITCLSSPALSGD